MSKKKLSNRFGYNLGVVVYKIVTYTKYDEKE